MISPLDEKDEVLPDQQKLLSPTNQVLPDQAMLSEHDLELEQSSRRYESSLK